MNEYDPAAMFKRLMMGQAAPPQAVTPPAGAAPSATPEATNEDMLRSLFMSSGGGSTEGRPDPIGGVNHQGRALATLKQMMAGSAGAGGGSGGGK